MSEENRTAREEADFGARAVDEASEIRKENMQKKDHASFGKLFGGGKKPAKEKPSRDRAEDGRGSEENVRKLTRTELLELLIDETRESDRLREENRILREEVEKCREELDRVASLDAVIARLEMIVNGRR